jgi:glucokinase
MILAQVLVALEQLTTGDRGGTGGRQGLQYNPVMLLAGDVGGTKTLLGAFERGDRRPTMIVSHSYVTTAYGSFAEILDAFVRDAGDRGRIDAVAVGVAGPVVGDRARLTNIDWDVSVEEVSRYLGAPRVTLLNDLEAMANSVEVLTPDEFAVLQEGVPSTDGNAAVIAAGTGLGEAYLHRVGTRLSPIPSEGGHADFAARTDRELELVRMLRELYGRAEVEHVLCGPGLLNLHRFTHRGGQCALLQDAGALDTPALVTQGGMTGRCQGCAEALRMFVSAYGAEAGNLALRGVATSGLYVGGGIAPKILRALTDGTFMEAFLAKPPMTALLSRMPVKVILCADAGLIGAAVHAQRLVG